jgi:hypothetical protein
MNNSSALFIATFISPFDLFLQVNLLVSNEALDVDKRWEFVISSASAADFMKVIISVCSDL